jgi:hypothetical protein
MNSLAIAMLLFAAAQEAAPPAVPAAPPPPAEKKVCRSERTTGSNLPGKRTCRTRAQWDAIDRAANAAGSDSRKSLDDMRNNRRIGNNGG